MTTIQTPHLLLDNEQLRKIMREREQWPAGQSAHMPAIVRQLVKPDIVAALACLQPPPTETGFWPQQDWPVLLRQLHLELGSSTQLRPIARIMDRTSLLPDPFVAQGGFWQSSNPPPLPHAQHPTTHLYTALRLDVVLVGSLDIATGNGLAERLTTGDGWLTGGDTPSIAIQPDSNAILWTEFYYSPEPCCCKLSDTSHLNVP